jgi:hypothetical protein
MSQLTEKSKVRQTTVEVHLHLLAVYEQSTAAPSQLSQSLHKLQIHRKSNILVTSASRRITILHPAADIQWSVAVSTPDSIANLS